MGSCFFTNSNFEQAVRVNERIWTLKICQILPVQIMESRTFKLRQHVLSSRSPTL